MSSLATELKTAIETWTDNLRVTSPLGDVVRQGGLTPHALAVYLESLRFLFHSSYNNLPLAIQRSKELGDPGLIDYFERKSVEEVGHDRWATTDLAQLPKGIVSDIEPAPSVRALVNLQRQLIDRHPLCFVAYITWTEYFTALIGDEWLDALTACGYGRTQVSAITNHVEADREHAPAGLKDLDRLWRGNPDAATILKVVEEGGRIFEAFCAEVAREARLAA